jgi:YesN/AraC family two-component response regulator
VLTATNGKLALEILVQEPGIELLFSDVVMPGGMNGYELAEQACLIRPDLKVMLTSGYTEMAVARNGQARFNANLLSKPYTLMTLTQRVREILD